MALHALLVDNVNKVHLFGFATRIAPFFSFNARKAITKWLKTLLLSYGFSGPKKRLTIQLPNIILKIYKRVLLASIKVIMYTNLETNWERGGWPLCPPPGVMLLFYSVVQ